MEDRQSIDKEGLRRRRSTWDPDEEEETMTYQDRSPVRFLNQEKGTFGSVFSKGINTAESAFDRTTLFRTDKRK